MIRKGTKKIHVVGIRGMGASAFAVIASEKGYCVTGSDETNYSVADDLLYKHPEITVYDSFDENHILNADLVVRSVAYNEDNVEVSGALKRGIQVLTYPQAVGSFLNEYSGIAVAGCNGKTTTTGMLATILSDCGLDPSYIVGAPLRGSMDNAHSGKSDLFIVEADEYRDAFHNYAPDIKYGILTNIDHDHPDYFPQLEDVIASFQKFVELLPRDAKLLVCGDDEENKRLLERIDKKVETYGFGKSSDWLADLVNQEELRSTFRLSHRGQEVGRYEIRVPGRHNILNASAALAIGTLLGIDAKLMGKSLLSYRGSRRRFEQLYDDGTIAVIDDYAHHPMAIEATILAARQRYPQRDVVVVFQPHTYSRTNVLLKEFALALSKADAVFLLDIYGSVREKSEGSAVTISDLVSATKRFTSHVELANNIEVLIGDLLSKRKMPTAVLTLGAGDIGTNVGENLARRLNDE